MSDHRQKAEKVAEEFLERFGFKSKVEEILTRTDDEHLPLVLAANVAIFGAACAILFTSNETGITATKLLILIVAISSLSATLLNIWYFSRIRIRIRKFKEEQERVYGKAKNNLIKAFDLFFSLVQSVVSKEASLLVSQSKSKEEFLEKFKASEGTDFNEILTEKGAFIFQNVMEISRYETIENYEKSLDAPLKERGATFNLFLDRLSTRIKNWALVVNGVLVLCALLVKTIVG